MAELVIQGLGESITEAIIGRWLKAVGDYVDIDEAVLDLETDKVNVDVTSPTAGILKEQRFGEGDTVKVGDVVGMIEEAERPASTNGSSPAPTAPPTSPAPTKGLAPTPPTKGLATGSISATPSAAPIAELRDRDSTGRLMTPSMRRSARKTPTPENRSMPTRATTPTSDGREQVVPMSPLRKRIAERLVEAQQSSASLTTFNEVDLSEVMALRERFREQFIETHGIKLGFMSFFVKAAVAALAELPGINAEVRGEAIVYKKFYDIGIAVGTDRGLVVPVLRGADALSFAEIEKGIVALATKARARKLVLDDLLGATFTITNGGIYGSMLSTPLLNYPQTGILGMHNIIERPVVIDGRVEIRPMMYVALTYDHRVVDGKEAVRFLVSLKNRLEQPDRMLLDV